MAIAATPCDRPTARLGVGTICRRGLVLTAAHVVEDELRDVEVDGQPARVVALDARIDAAVLEVEAPIGSAARRWWPTPTVADAVRISRPSGVIEHHRRANRHARPSTTRRMGPFIAVRRWCSTGAVPAGTSGAPVVDDDGRVVGMVTISHAGRDVTYATADGELQGLDRGCADTGLDSVTQSSLAAPRPCA